MIKTVFSLELRKHRHSFLSMALVLTLGMVVVAIFAPRSGDVDLVGALRGWFILMLSYGVPLIALFFGTVCGNTLRREPEVNVEEPLPVSPAVRVSGAWSAGLLYSFLLGFAGCLVAGMFVQSDTLSQILADSLMASFQLNWWFLLLQIFSLSFVLSYWSRQPLLAAGATAIVAFIECYLATYSYDVVHLFDPWRISYSSNIPLVVNMEKAESYLRIPVFLGAFAAIRSIFLFARRLERGISVGWKKGILIVLFLGCGVLIAFLGALFVTAREPAAQAAWSPY